MGNIPNTNDQQHNSNTLISTNSAVTTQQQSIYAEFSFFALWDESKPLSLLSAPSYYLVQKSLPCMQVQTLMTAEFTTLNYIDVAIIQSEKEKQP